MMIRLAALLLLASFLSGCYIMPMPPGPPSRDAAEWTPMMVKDAPPPPPPGHYPYHPGAAFYIFPWPGY